MAELVPGASSAGASSAGASSAGASSAGASSAGALSPSASSPTSASAPTPAPAIVVHGGAGLVAPERHAALRVACRAAAAAGHAILARGGSALDAVVAAVRVLEDDPATNAGRGSVLTRERTIETDACVMEGATQRVGAVAAVPGFGQAIALARAVLDDGEHVLLAGPAALAFAAHAGLVAEPAGPLVTERAARRWCEEAVRRGALAEGDIAATIAAILGSAASISAASTSAASTSAASTSAAGGEGTGEREGGTVGAVARDLHGRFAAATSTGGINYKRAGRVGDSPIAGAGTWADAQVAISATGDGEAILRVALAHMIATRVALDPEAHRDRAARGGDGAARDLARAVRAALAELVAITGGSAGVIAIDASGWVALQRSPTMPIAWIDADGAGDAMGTSIGP